MAPIFFIGFLELKSLNFLILLGGNYMYEGWNFNSGNYLFKTDTK